MEAKRHMLVQHINQHYPEQLTDPHKKKRRCFSQFGYNLSFFRWQLFPITQFIDPNHFGTHSYGQPHPKEKNGVVYTCKGGFLDVSHLRAATDWTVYLTFKILNEPQGFDLPEELGSLRLDFKNIDELSLEEVATMSQKIAYERLLWHEIVSWYYHGPNHLNSEQQSAFTPEDTYSNLLGTVIGKNVALRILTLQEDLTYEQIATEEINKMVATLQPLSIEACIKAYDKVDRYKQLQLPAKQRNADVWWDSNIIFRDQRYVFKRYMNIGPVLEPWLVPGSEELNCPEYRPSSSPLQANTQTALPVETYENDLALSLTVPLSTAAGKSYYEYYNFHISPSDVLFFSTKTGEQLHDTFEPFNTKDIGQVVSQVGKEMEATLLPGYDVRDNFDPVPHFGKLKRVERSNRIPFAR